MREQCYRLGLKRRKVEWRWVTNTAGTEEKKSAYSVLVGTSKGKRKLGRHKRTQEDYTEICLKETGRESL